MMSVFVLSFNFHVDILNGYGDTKLQSYVDTKLHNHIVTDKVSYKGTLIPNNIMKF